jgi:uncharacterized protein (DUF2267 family)
MTTGLGIFDTTVQESNLWLKDLMERLGASDRRHEAQFLARVRQELPRADEAEVRAAISAVFDLLAKKIDSGEAVKLAGVLPKELRGFWPAFIQVAARAKSAGAA